MTSLVLGAGGFLGLNLVDALIAHDEQPRCGRRKRSNVLALRERRVPLVQADLDSPEELREAMRGCEVVYHLAGHYPRLSLDHDGAVATGIQGLNRVLDAAADSGVRRLVYVSSTATIAPDPSGAPSSEQCTFTGTPGFGTYHDLKWAMEQRALEEYRLDVVVACPGACLGPWDLRVGTSAILVALARGLDPPHPDGVISPVDARDVAIGLYRLAHYPVALRRVIFAGKNRRLHALLVELAARYAVRPPSPALQAGAAQLLADQEERRSLLTGGRPALSREIADLVVHGVPVSARLAETALGLTFRPLEQTLHAADEWHRRMRILPAAEAKVSHQ